MKGKLHLATAVALLAMSVSSLAADNPDHHLSIPLNAGNRLYLGEYQPGLLMSIRKLPSAAGSNAGWGLEVLRRPITADTPNLLQSRTGVVVHAADIAARKVRYPQTMLIAGTPYQLRVDLQKPKVQGKGADAHFVGGTLELDWQEK